MRMVIRADLRRILAKPGLYILPLLAVIFIVLNDPAETAAEQMDMLRNTLSGLFMLAVSIPVYLSVYSDEIKSGAMISVIGRGFPRNRVVKAKLCDTAILLTGFYLIAFATAVIKNSFTDLVITPKQNAFLFVFIVLCIIRAMGYFALSSLVVFLSWSAPAGMFMLITYLLLAKAALSALQDKFKIPVFDYSLDGLMDRSFTSLQIGNADGALIAAMLIYICLVVLLTNVFFKRKELEL